MRKNLSLVICVFMLNWFSNEISAGEQYDSYNMPKFIVGAGTHFGHHKGIVSENLSLISQAGITGVRDAIEWYKCETTKNNLIMPEWYMDYNKKTSELGLIPIEILCYTNSLYDGGDYPRTPESIEGFARFCEFTVNKLQNHCRLYQVWNEWDAGLGLNKKKFGTGKPEDYINLLKVVYPRIKKINPNAVIISNSVTCNDEYLEKLLKLGLLKYCDVVARHPYNFYSRGTPEDWYKHMRKVDTMLRKYNSGKEVPLYVTEMGWPTQIDSQGITSEKSASYIAQMYLMARTIPFLKGIWWYDFQNDGWKDTYSENNFGMVKSDLTPKPGYNTISDISHLVQNADFVERVDVKDDKLWVLKFKYSNGKEALALWSTYPDNDWQFTLKNSSSQLSSVAIRRVGSKAIKRNWLHKAWDDAKWADRPKVKELAGIIKLTVRDRPWIIEGDLSNVSVENVVKRKFEEEKRVVNSLIVVPPFIAKATPLGAQPVTYNFGHPKNYCRLKSNSAYNSESLNAHFSMQYTDDKIILNVEVIDDLFSQEYDNEKTWKGDGLQIGLKALGSDNERASLYNEIDIALTKNGPIAYRQKSSNIEEKPGKLKQVTPHISRTAKTTTYNVEIPIKLIGLTKLKAGNVIGFSLLVNENDGKGRVGYLHWGKGIGSKKDPLLYNWIMMDK